MSHILQCKTFHVLPGKVSLEPVYIQVHVFSLQNYNGFVSVAVIRLCQRLVPHLLPVEKERALYHLLALTIWETPATLTASFRYMYH